MRCYCGHSPFGIQCSHCTLEQLKGADRYSTQADSLPSAPTVPATTTSRGLLQIVLALAFVLVLAAGLAVTCG